MKAWSALFALLVAACAPSDQQQLEEMVRTRLADPPGLKVTEAVIYRAGEGKAACLTAKYQNNWGEEQPEVRILAWYVFHNRSWHTDNPRKMDDGLDCHQYVAQLQ